MFCQCSDVHGATHEDETPQLYLCCSRTKIMEQSAGATMLSRDTHNLQETTDIFVFRLGCGT